MKALIDRLNANFSLLSMTTPEEARARLEIARAASVTKRKLYLWSITRGLESFTADGGFKVEDIAAGDPGAGARLLGGGPDDKLAKDSILVLLDFAPYLKDPVVVRSLRDALPQARERMNTGIFLGAALELPPELRREVAEIELPMPDATDIERTIAATVEANKKMKGLVAPEGERLSHLIEAGRGLTAAELENALALSLVAHRQIEASVISGEKARAIKTSGALEILKPPPGGLDAVGGLGAVKEWIRTRARAFSPEAKAYGLPNPKGALLAGIPGTGKSLAAKAAAATLDIPLVRLDVGALFGGLVGESESNVRAALKTIDAIAPCVVMIDEIEKAFAGSSAGRSGDSGTSSRVLGSFLTWTQEHESPVFLIATANDVTSLPPEMLRKGRWDTMLFVDLPALDERQEILRIHLAIRKRDPVKFDLPKLAALADGFSGAEIEQAIIDAMFAAFSDGREIVGEDIVATIRATVPLSKTSREQIQALRDWAKTRCTPANGVKAEAIPAPKSGRAIANN